MEVNVHEAKTHLSRLLRRVAEGEEITISRAGVPVAKLIALGPEGQPRPTGMDRDKLWMAEDFDAPDAELEALFYGEASATKLAPKRRPLSTAHLPHTKGKKKA
jgi:prevent-host-death family protein